MAISITTSEGEAVACADPGRVRSAVRQLFADTPGPRLRYVLLTDERGNELQVTAAGSVRLCYQARPDVEYGLPAQEAGTIDRLCAAFAAGDLEAFRQHPWQVELPADADGAAEERRAEEVRREAAARDGRPAVRCDRCDVEMQEGVVQGHGHRAMWQSRNPKEGRLWGVRLPVRALRCPACGVIQFFA